MKVNQLHSLPEEEAGPRLQLKRVARKLIAERGVHDVSVREIALAADQRNLGVVAYYFGTKDKLVADILIDGAARIEARRQVYLDAMEAEGGPKTLTDAVKAIVLPSASFADDDEIYGNYFNRFILQVSYYKSGFIDETLDGRWNTGYQRCLTHFRRLMPHLTQAEQSRRYVFFASYIGLLLAQRESMRADDTKSHPTWTSNETLLDIVQTATALLDAPILKDDQA
ncbi:TetR/AcrR family transcriptional regulator [Ponticaulis profundi]|uniref:TetR/AcrR family transcriptional regulator n=1 Tax=Ponticaulis profundi TaxID=2665222 RepID=A0ABW1SDD7_9PROT